MRAWSHLLDQFSLAAYTTRSIHQFALFSSLRLQPLVIVMDRQDFAAACFGRLFLEDEAGVDFPKAVVCNDGE